MINHHHYHQNLIITMTDMTGLRFPFIYVNMIIIVIVIIIVILIIINNHHIYILRD